MITKFVEYKDITDRAMRIARKSQLRVIKNRALTQSQTSSL